MSFLYMGYIVPATILFPLITIVLRRKKISGSGFYIITAYLILTLAISIAAKALSVNHISNLPLIHIDTIVEIVLLLLYFSTLLKGKIIKAWLVALVILFPLSCFINFLFFQSIYNFNTYTRPAGALILITLCIIYWWEYGNKEPDKEWTAIPDNWFVSGILFYFSGAFLLFIFSNYLAVQYDTDTNIFIWNLHGTLLISFYLFFTKGFLSCKK